MQHVSVIKHGQTSDQVSMQPGVVTVPMTVNSSTSGSIPNVTTINKPGAQNVIVSTQNSAPSAILPTVQNFNMRPSAPSVAAPNSVATFSPRIVIGTPQVAGTRAAVHGITLQTLQSLQGHQGNLLLMTENGQYQLLRIGPAPSTTLMAPLQTLRLPTVPALPGVPTVSTSVVAPGPMAGQMSAGPMATLVPTSSVTTLPSPVTSQLTVTTHKPLDITYRKCRNFFVNLLDTCSKQPTSVERGVRNLIQELIDAQVEPKEFCGRLERLINATPQPCLIGFLKKSLPLLRQSLVTKELVIEGINPPSPPVASSLLPAPSAQAVPNNNINLQKPPPKAIGVLQNIPVHSKINVNMVGKTMPVNSKTFTRPTSSAAPLSTVLTVGKSLLKEKEKNSGTQFTQPFSDDMMAADDDINDVATMGGINLAEETQKILGSTDMIGTQIRSCKDRYLIPLQLMQARIKALSAKQGLQEPWPEVAGLIIQAVQERLKSIVEKLVVIAKHRVDMRIKTDTRYEVTQDVKGQLNFIEELDRMQKKKRENIERELLLRAAKSKSKNEDPEQAALRAKAKEMQRAEQEELRQREANLTALQAIGPRKKKGDPSGSLGGHGGGFSGRSQLALRTRVTRINHRDMIYFLEQERDTSRSVMLYRSYLK